MAVALTLAKTKQIRINKHKRIGGEILGKETTWKAQE